MQIFSFKVTPNVRFDHCALVSDTKQLTFDHFCQVSAENFKNCEESGLIEKKMARGPLLFFDILHLVLFIF